MKIWGLTGSIGMGKSTVAKMFSQERFFVHDADEAVHQGFKNKNLLKTLKTIFPEAVGKTVDRKKLSKIVFKDKNALKNLEKICHDFVEKDRQKFLSLHQRLGTHHVLLDVPLLFETGLDALCHGVFVVTCPKTIQKHRVMQRNGMTEEKFQAILNRQMADKEKRLRADAIIQTGSGKHMTYKQVIGLIKCL